MRTKINTNIIKKIVSWLLGIPAVFLIVCEAELELWWVQAIACITFLGVIVWNKSTIN